MITKEMSPKIIILVIVFSIAMVVILNIPAEPIPDEIIPVEDEQMFCIELFEPVCSTSGKTYSNSCYLEVAGDQLDHMGECL